MLGLAACGGAGEDEPGPTLPQRAGQLPVSPPASGTQKKQKPRQGLHRASRAATKVINAWADTLRAGHPGRAARYFDVPAIVQNAGPAVRLETRSEVLAFNRTLPCGAHVVKLVAGRRYTVATFVLTERPGSPGCGATGKLAATAFRLRHGKISEWRRVLVPPPLGPETNLTPRSPVV